MTSISNVQHQAFCKAITDELAKTGAGAALRDRRIEEYLQHMERFRMDYMQHLRTLQSLVVQYESAKKEARMLLRKRLAAQKLRADKKTKVIGRSISKAS